MSPFMKKGLFVAKIAAFTLPLVALYYFLFIPNVYLASFLVGWINHQGWGQFQIKSISLGLDGIRLRQVTYTPSPQIPSLEMRSAKIKLQWESFSPQIKGVILKDLILQKETIEKMMEGPSTEALSFPPLSFENAQILSDDEAFPFQLRFDGTLKPGDSFQTRVSFSFSEGLAQGNLRVDLSGQTIQGDLSDLSLKIKGWENLSFSGKGEFQLESNTIKGKLRGGNSALKINAQYTYNVQNQEGEATFAYQAQHIEKVVPQQWTKDYSIEDLSGTVKGSAHAKIKAGVLDPIQGTIGVPSISFKHPFASVKNLSTSLQYRWDKAFLFPKQALHLHIENVDIGVPLSDLSLNVTWNGENGFLLQNGKANLAGGEITTRDVTVDLPIQDVNLPLHLSYVPAQFLIDFSQVPSLKVTGHITGFLDLLFNTQGYGIRKGSSLSIQDPPGKIQYRPGDKPPQVATLKGDENPMDLVFLALWNFKYEKMSLDLEKPLDGKLEATLILNGKNPNLLQGHPFHFKIKAGGQLKELIENLFQSIKRS